MYGFRPFLLVMPYFDSGGPLAGELAGGVARWLRGVIDGCTGFGIMATLMVQVSGISRNANW